MPQHRPLRGSGTALLYGLAVANALLVFFDFTFRNGGASLPLRLVFALGFAVLPFLVALILARIFTSSDLGVSSSFEVNLEIFWSLGLIVAVLAVVIQMQLA